MHKMINLDDEATQVEIKAGGKSFIIARVTSQMRSLYGEYIQMCSKYLYDAAETNTKLETATDEEKEVLENVQTERIKEYSQKRIDDIFTLLEIILSKNGYTYFQKWWEENCDFYQIEMFVINSVMKDNETAKKKTVV